MNTEVIVNVDVLEYLPAKTLLKLVEHSQQVAKALKVFKQTIHEVGPLFRALEEMDIDLQFNPQGDYIAFCFTGDGERLKRVWVELRRNGYKTVDHPKKGDTTFYTFWCREGYASLFMNFSSSVCRRVQVGTKMVETPIFETHCGDLPEIEGGEAPVPEVVDGGLDDVPF